MKRPSAIAFFRSRYPLGILAGVLLALSFPNPNIAGLAWIAPALMLAAGAGLRGAQRFRVGYVAGFTHYLISLSWLLNIPVTGFPILGWMALSGFLALFPATWVWLCVPGSSFRFQISDFKSQTPNSQLPTPNSSPRAVLTAMSEMSWGRRVLWSLGSAATWVAFEMIIARIFGGFPWNLLGASQFRMLPLIQISSFTGVYGVSFLVAWTSISLLCAVAMIVARPNLRSFWARELFFPFAAGAAAFLFGIKSLSPESVQQAHIGVTMIQPSIPQTMIWDSDNDMERFAELLRLSSEAVSDETDVLVWPEAAVPGLPRYNRAIGAPILEFAREHRIWMIIGADDAEVTPAATNFFNATFLVSPDGKLEELYRKRSLVMFGEYIPLEKSLPFLKWFTPVTGSYTSGDRAIQFEMSFTASESGTNGIPELAPAISGTAPAWAVRAAPLICFEDNFPHLAREYAETDTDFLVNLTNNGWFGEGAAQWQHAANSVFRAIENGLPLVRCTNNGLTCRVDANGRVRDVLRGENGTLYGKGFTTIKVPVLNEGQFRTATFYNQHGDVFGWSCVAVAGLMAVGRGTRFRGAARSPSGTQVPE